MLDSLRKSLKSIVVNIFIGLLVLSFAVWGIADIFSGFGSQTLAKVGETEISQEEFRDELQRQISFLSNRVGRQLTQAETNQLGIPRQVLNQLITDAALNNQARTMGLGISDQALANSIFKDPTFKDASGQFNRDQFENILQNNGLNEAIYTWRQRGVMVRQQIAQAAMADATAPKTMISAINRYLNQTRKVSYFVLPSSAVAEIAAPSEEAMKTWHAKHPALYTAPEFRSIAIIELKPETVAATIEITDADVKTYYEENKAAWRSKEETRDLDQLAFTSADKAQEAYDKLVSGADFMTIAKEYGFTEEAIRRPALMRSTMIDQGIAQAAFILKKGAYSAPVKTLLGAALVRVREITPPVYQPLDEVKDDAKKKLALERSNEEILDIHDAVEDERAGGATLKDIAAKMNLKFIEVPAISQTGLDKNGVKVKVLPNSNDLLKLAFESDVGVENDPVSAADNGYWWLDVTGVIPSRLKDLASVTEQVKQDWTKDKRAAALEAKAKESVKTLSEGVTLEGAAKAAGHVAETSGDFKRNDPEKPFSSTLIASIFATPKDKVVIGLAANGLDRVIAQVTGVTEPDAKADDEAVKAIASRARQSIGNDLMLGYVNALRESYGVTINNTIFQTLTGTGG